MEVVEDLRCIGAVTDLRLIVSIDDTVTVHILILDVTGTNGREGLSRTVGYVSIILEQADGNQTIGRLQRIAGLHKVVEGLRLLSHLLDLILVVIERTSQVESQLTDGLGVVEREFDTLTVYLSGIRIRSLETDKSRISTCTRHPDVLALLHIGIQFHIQAAKERGVYAYIILIGLLVSGINGSHTATLLCTKGISRIGLITTTERIVVRGISAIGLYIVVPDIITRQIVGIDNAEAGPELQEVHDGVVLQETFIGEHPGCGHRRTKVPLRIGSQTVTA